MLYSLVELWSRILDLDQSCQFLAWLLFLYFFFLWLFQQIFFFLMVISKYIIPHDTAKLTLIYDKTLHNDNAIFWYDWF